MKRVDCISECVIKANVILYILLIYVPRSYDRQHLPLLDKQ